MLLYSTSPKTMFTITNQITCIQILYLLYFTVYGPWYITYDWKKMIIHSMERNYLRYVNCNCLKVAQCNNISQLSKIISRKSYFTKVHFFTWVRQRLKSVDTVGFYVMQGAEAKALCWTRSWITNNFLTVMQISPSMCI